MVILVIKIIGVVLLLLLTMMIVIDIVIGYDNDTNKDDIYHCC